MRRLSAALLLVLTLGLGVSPASLWADDMAHANGAATGESLSASTQLGAAGDALAVEDSTADVAAPSDDTAADGEHLTPVEQPDATPAPDAGAAAQTVEVLDYTGIELSEERIVLGQTVVVTPQVSGMDEAGLRFNYVWNYEGAWKEWSSTVKETGSQTADATWKFTPSRVGRYEIYIDVVQPDGTTLTKTTTLTVMQNWAVDDLVVTVGDDAYEAAMRLLDSGEEFSAIFCISDMMAIAAIKALEDRGLGVPGDCSVIGIDGLEFSEYTRPTLTTLVQPRERMGAESVRILMDMIEGRGGNRHVLLDTELRPGGSVRAV